MRVELKTERLLQLDKLEFASLFCLFQGAQAAVDRLDLLLHHRDLLGKAVVEPDLPGQLLDLGVRDRLGSRSSRFLSACRIQSL